MHFMFSVYFVNQPLRVSGIFVAQHQEVCCVYTTRTNCCIYIYIYIQYTVCVQHVPIVVYIQYTVYATRTNCCIYTVYLLMMGYKYARNM